MATKLAVCSSAMRAVRFESLESRHLLSIQPCLFDVPQQGAATRAVESVNCFGADVYSQLQQTEGNLFFSPLSVATALAMTYAGAAGQTAEEMEDVLHLGSEPGIHESFAALLSTLADRTAAGDGFTLELANAIWPQTGLPILPDFLRTIITAYDGAAQNVDYSNPEEARQTINAWVEEQTRGRIQELLQSLSPATIMVLTNSIYFQANWTEPFDPCQTGAQGNTFHLANGETVETPLMNSQIFLPEYTFLDGFQILEMPLEWGRTSMVFVLPEDPAVTPNQLTPEILAKIDAWLETPRDLQLTDVILPRFTTTVSAQLEGLLAAMGMPSAFEPGADFSNMTPEGASIRQVRHKAFIDVNEHGTEAAAATAVEIYLCFAAGTPVLTSEGEKPIEEILPGDYVVCRNEWDATAKVERKPVEAVFRGHAELFELSIGGQVIRATREHCFYVQEKGWTALGDLQAGDLLATDERAWMPVEKVASSGKLARVYNLRVADHHTYFVGSQTWKFALWTHNDYFPTFRADHPFHFYIRDNVSTAVLFMGRVEDPTQTENDIQPEFVPDLDPNISGTIYHDANQDGVRDAGEPALEGFTVFVDANRNGVLDDAEPRSISGPDGSYSLRPSLFSGPVTVALAQQDDEPPVPSREVMLTSGEQLTGVDMGSPTETPWASPLAAQLDATDGDDTIVLRRSGDNLEVFLDDPLTSPPSLSQPVDSVPALRIRLLDGNDRVIVDYSGGNPLPAGGLLLEGGGGQTTLRTTGPAQGRIHVSGGIVDIPMDPGRISLFVEQGASVRFGSSAHLAALHVKENGELIAAPTGGVLRASALTVGSRASLVLESGVLIVDSSQRAHEAQLKQYIHNGQLRYATWPNYKALLNNRGNGTPRLTTIAGEEVDVLSVIVARILRPDPIGDFNDNGLIDQGDLDLVLEFWGADAAAVRGSGQWERDLPSGIVDQEELDAVLANWGRITEFQPLL